LDLVGADIKSSKKFIFTTCRYHFKCVYIHSWSATDKHDQELYNHIMSYKETDLASDISKWIRNEFKQSQTAYIDLPPPLQNSALLEYKITKTNTFNYKSWLKSEPQQFHSLKKAKHDYIYFKLSDLDPRRKPADAMLLVASHAYLTICWYKKRTKKQVYFIDIDEIEKDMKVNKSLTEKKAKEIAVYDFKIKSS